MAIRPIKTLKNWFLTGMYPTQEQFHDWMDSYWHKSEQLPGLDGRQIEYYQQDLQNIILAPFKQYLSINKIASNTSLSFGENNGIIGKSSLLIHNNSDGSIVVSIPEIPSVINMEDSNEINLSSGEYLELLLIGYGEKITLKYRVKKGSVDPSVPEYNKYPIQTRFFVNRQNQAGQTFNVLSKDWDKESYDDFAPGGYNPQTLHVRRVGNYLWTLEPWKQRYKTEEYSGQYAYINTKQSQIDAAGIGATLEEIERRDGCYMYADQSDNPMTSQYLFDIDVTKERSWYNSPMVNKIEKDNGVIRYLNIVDESGVKKVVEDNNVTALVYRINAGQTATLSCIKNYGTITAHVMYDMPENIVTGYEITNYRWTNIPAMAATQSDPSRFYALFNDNSYNGTFVIIIPEKLSYDQIKALKFKLEDGANTNPVYSGIKDEVIETGWQIPTIEDFMELFGMAGALDKNTIFSQLFSSNSDTEFPYTGVNIGNDDLGARLTAAGHRANDPGFNYGFLNYGTSAFFATYFNPFDGSDFYCPTINMYKDGSGGTVNYFIGLDNGENMPTINDSTRFWFRNVRFCKKLSDEEIGYKFYRDDANDKILIVSHTAENPAVQPINTVEIKPGLLRGMARRWMNITETQVTKPLSYFLSEMEKAKTNGEYGWYGFDEYLN